MSKHRINLKSLINEGYEGAKIWQEESNFNVEKFQKIKHKPKHSQNEINEFQSRKKKFNRTKRGK